MKRKYKLSTIFTVGVFLTLLISIVVGIILNIFLPFDFNFKGTLLLRLIFGVLLCSATGTVISHLIGQHTLNTILQLNNATKEIAGGNYNIRIDETSKLIELSDMVESFNTMANDLAMNDMMKNDFINNVSHDFKTPLSAIEGYATLLTNKNLPPETVSEYAKSVLLNSKRLTKMTSNILLLSTLDNSKIELNKTTFSLDEQICDTVLLFQKEWETKNIELDIDLDKTSFNADKDMLFHVWQNLVSNAIKFCNENGRVSVRLKSIKNNAVEATFSNTGAYVSEDVKRRIFDKFYQSDSSRASKGNGLGLPIVKKIVDLHGGEIKVASEEHKDTTFIVVLP